MNDPGPIPDFLARTSTKPLVGSYTMLAAYKNCPHAMFRRYIKKDQKYVETPEMKWGNDVHTALEYRVGSGKILPEKMQQWEPFAAAFDGRNVITEQKLGVTREGKSCGFWDDGVFFRGKVDITMIEGAVCYINDFKTGKSSYEDPLELETCALLLHAKHPALTKMVGQYTWLKESRAGQLYTLTDTQKTWESIHSMMAEIERLRADGDFEKKKSGLCGWCSVSDCEHWRPKK